MAKEYTEVNCIKIGTGKPYIDTGVSANNLISIEATIEMPTDSYSEPHYFNICGCAGMYMRVYMSNAASVWFNYHNTNGSGTITSGTHTIKIDNASLYLDGRKIQTLNNEVDVQFSYVNNIGIYAILLRNSPFPGLYNVDYISRTKIYNIKIYKYKDNRRKEKETIRDFIPVIQSGVVGMFDKINNLFYAPVNQGEENYFNYDYKKEEKKESEKNRKIANFNYQYDYSPVLLWQYTNAPHIKAIIDNEQDFIDKAITDFRDEFDSKIFNIDTCDENGLDLWGRVLGVERPIIENEPASDEQYRLLLKSRFSLLVWDGSCYGLTKIIKNIFPNSIFAITDNLDMSASIQFAGGITEEELAILSIGYQDTTTGEFVYTFLPRPAGVSYNISTTDQWNTIFGFDGMTEIIDVGGIPTLKDGSTTNMGGAYGCDPDDHTGETGEENADGGVFYK